MMLDYVVAVEGLSSLNLDSLSEDERQNAARAINSTADRVRTAAARKMREQINFTAGYLNDRLTVTKRAYPQSLEAVIKGRDRPTMLARFLRGTPKRGVAPMVEVKPGVAKRVSGRAFLIKLGANKTNLGIAVRTNGEKPKRTYKPYKIGDNLWLLYGASVDQVFKSVRDEVSPDAANFLETEFLRLMALGDY